jgi:hypothetical protein
MDPNAFLYLNPTGIVGTTKLITSQEIMQLWNTDSNAFDGLPTNYDYLPELFNTKLFAIDHRDTIEFSRINKEIINSISYATTSDPYFFPNIYKQITCKSISSNGCVFSYDSTFGLVPGDIILIIGSKNFEIYTDVVSISATEFETSTTFVAINEVVILSGIKISDIDRLSRIAYYNYQLSNVIPYTPKNFNYKLYNLLYGFNFTTFEDAYIHAVINDNNSGGAQIYSADDIVNINSGGNVTVTQNVINTYQPNNIFEDITVNGIITFKDYGITYITTDFDRSLDIISADDVGLITEYAIKRYIDNMLYPKAVFADIEANSLTVQTLYLDKFVNDITFQGSITVASNVSTENIISDTSSSSRYGIGSTNNMPNDGPSFPDVSLNSLNVIGGIYSANTCQIDGEMLNSRDIKCKQCIYGSKIGIGQVYFDTSNNNINNGSPQNTNNTNNAIIDTSFVNTLYLSEGLFQYDNRVIEDLSSIVNVTNREYDLDSIVVTEPSKFITYNRNETVSGSAIVFGDSLEASLLRIGDTVVTDTGNIYMISDIDNNKNAKMFPDFLESNIYIKDLVLKDRKYIDVWNLLQETLGQLKELANKYNNIMAP